MHFSTTGLEVKEFDKYTRTAAEAAEALGCKVASIAKSIVFKTSDDRVILVIASGVNRISEILIENTLGTKLLKADAEFVKSRTGYVIGGVPPWGHLSEPTTYIDEDLNMPGYIWAAAGKNNAVFKLTFDQLVAKTKGRVMKVTDRAISSSK